MGDSAIWTGTYLAAEALRLMATGAPVARDNVRELVETLHLWFNVSGDPGMLARFATPASASLPYEIGDLDCSHTRVHCGVDYQGKSYDYVGHISRDQYQGVMLGYALAYQALGPEDEAIRSLIREDAVELVRELMKERTLPIQITYNGTALPTFDATMRFVVLSTRELGGGAIQLTLDSDDPDASEMWGFQEFTPNLQDLAKQIPAIGGFVPPIPRASSAIMLASFFQVGLFVTAGVAGYASEHAAMLDYYENHSGEGGNVSDWLTIAALQNDDDGCGESYYSNNITMEPLYNLATLEWDAARLDSIRGPVLGSGLWPRLADTKNVFFSFIYAASEPAHDPTVVTDAASQLAGFPLPPRVQVAVDLTSDPAYLPHHPSCPNQTAHDNAVDVADRIWADFMWQRQPWGLVDSPNPGRVAPGVDYLVAYWMGRHHAFLSEDAPGTCLAWR
jgi:hypothetical protein